MLITAIETIRLARGIAVHAGPIRWLWVRIHTDAGLVGLGETYPHPDAESAIVHQALAPVLLGRDPLAIDRLWADMFQAISYSGWAGAEMRAISAVDIALWDLAGKAAGAPIYQLLGGASRPSIRTYNTCYDHIDFLTEPVKLARDLARTGIHAMKIWPFDPVARETRGQYITAAQMRKGIEPLRLIREELGDSMDVAMEFHGFWSLPCAIEIAHALEPYSPMWLEEMLPQDNLAAYAELARATRLPLCLSERLMTRWGFRELLENRAARIIMPDISWCGEDRVNGGNVLSARRATQLWRACAARGLRASGRQSDQPAHSGNRAPALSRRVPRYRHQHGRSGQWHSAAASGSRLGRGTRGFGAHTV